MEGIFFLLILLILESLQSLFADLVPRNYFYVFLQCPGRCCKWGELGRSAGTSFLLGLIQRKAKSFPNSITTTTTATRPNEIKLVGPSDSADHTIKAGVH